MNPIPLPPPYGGQADYVPTVALEPPFAESVLNFNLDDGNAYLRNGDSVHSTKASVSVLELATYGNNMFLVYDGGGGLKVADVTAAGAPVDVYSPGGIGGDDEVHTLFFNNYLIFFGENTWKPSSVGNPQYNGSAWSLSGLTFPAATTPFGGGVFKNRGFILLRGTSRYVYTGINAISGATTEVDLAQIISKKATLYAIRAVSLSEGIQQETVLAFIFDTGEVLVYSGTYPDSASWGLVGKFSIPPPVYYNAVIEANGDVFVITTGALVSLRTLFTQGVEVAVEKGLSSPMRNRWEQIFSVPVFYGTKGVFDSKRQRITISLSNYIDRDGGYVATDGMRLIYSFKTNAWWEQRVKLADPALLAATIQSSAFFGGFVYSAVTGTTVSGVIKSEGASDFSDEQLAGGSDLGYEYEIVSAPVSGGRSSVQQCAGIDIIQQSDLYDRTEITLISDVGVTTSTAQKIPDMGTSMVKAHANTGLEGSYLQFKISGTTTTGKSVGLDIYGINFWSETGNSPR